jgi:hypothetical protein
MFGILSVSGLLWSNKSLANLIKKGERLGCSIEFQGLVENGSGLRAATTVGDVLEKRVED